LQVGNWQVANRKERQLASCIFKLGKGEWNWRSVQGAIWEFVHATRAVRGSVSVHVHVRNDTGSIGPMGSHHVSTCRQCNCVCGMRYLASIGNRAGTLARKQRTSDLCVLDCYALTLLKVTRPKHQQPTRPDFSQVMDSDNAAINTSSYKGVRIYKGGEGIHRWGKERR